MTGSNGGESDEKSPPDDDDKRRMNEHIRRAQPGAELLVVTAKGKERTLTVIDEDYPEWMDGEAFRPSESTKVLSGYGTTYLLQGHSTDKGDRFPWLYWPSRERGIVVWDVEIENPGTPIRAEKRAEDIIWRVDRHGGR